MRHVGRTAVRLAAAGVAAAAAAQLLTSCAGGAVDALPGVPGTPFSDGGAWEYIYITADPEFGYPATRFEDITDRLHAGDFEERGITNIMIYGPYASTARWRGLPATGDLMDVDPANGTMEDWRRMARAASERGITITVYLALLYLDESSPLFVKAQEDRARGIPSWESRLLLWDPRDRVAGETYPGPPSERLVPRPGEGRWAFSRIAGEWYATSWEHPAINYGDDAAMEFAHRVMAFWMDNGVQGFELDAPQTMWGLQDGGPGGVGERRHAELVTFPERYRPAWEVYTEAEGIGTFARADMLDRVGYSHLMLNPDSDDDTFVQQAIRGEMSLDELDLHYRTYIDTRRERGQGVYAPLIYNPALDPEAIALDAAVQGGSGALISFDRQLQLDVLPTDVVDMLHEVTRALAASSAEAPSASRSRLTSTAAELSYAIVRRSAADDSVAVNVYNLSRATSRVVVAVAGAVADGARLVDMRDGAVRGEVRDGAFTVDLEPWGWVFLGVEPPR